MKAKKLISFALAAFLLTCVLVGFVNAAAVYNLGDVDGNGEITAIDARLALRVSAKIEMVYAEQNRAADMDADGSVTATDARTILRISARLEPMPEWTTAAITTSQSPTTTKPRTTRPFITRPITTRAATTEPSTEITQPEIIAFPTTTEEVLAVYTQVVNQAKAAQVGYLKKEYQSIPEDSANRKISKGNLAVKTILSLATQSFTAEKDAKVEAVHQGSDMKWFPVPKNEKGCYLTDADFIKSSSAVRLSNGNIKLSITLKDELNSQPTPDGSGQPVSKIGAMFYPLSIGDIVDVLEDPSVSKIIRMDQFSLNYHDCRATIEYNPESGQLVTLEQVLVVGLKAMGKAAGVNFDFFQNIYDTIQYWDISY